MTVTLPPEALGAWILGAVDLNQTADASSQAEALCIDFYSQERVAAKRSDLRKGPIDLRGRKVLTDPDARHRKIAVETGYDLRFDTWFSAPLEAWTCDDSPSAMMLYQQIGRAPDGTYSLADMTEANLAHLAYMKAEGLIHVGAEDRIHLLSDPAATDNRSRYPGAPMDDRKAAIGRQLRLHARGLVLAAIWRIRQSKTWNPVKKADAEAMAGENGSIRLPVRLVCAEANAAKARTRSLDEYRYLSVDTCGRMLRDLLEDGILREYAKPRSIRLNRRWVRIPRSYSPDYFDISIKQAGPIDEYMGPDPAPPRLIEYPDILQSELTAA